MNKNNILKRMIRDRVLEENILSLFKENKLYGTTHLSIGQEALSSALGLVCSKEDYIVPTHRCHTHSLNKGSSMQDILAEMMGLKSGLSGGLCGSMHLCDVENNNPGGSAVVGSSVPLSIGIAYGLKLQNKKGVVFSLFGDAASNRGSVHEAMNMASIYNLPVVFLCENNIYGMSTNYSFSTSVSKISTRSISYNMEGITFDANDVEKSIKVLEYAKSVAKENKPILIEGVTYRQCGHSKLEPRKYRSKEEEMYWIEKDPIKSFVKKYNLEKEEEQYYKESNEEFLKALKYLEKNNEKISLKTAMSFVYGESRC